MKLSKKVREFDIEAHTMECDVSYRGGTLKVDVGDLFNVPNAIMGAYQNYLGGGIAGAIVGCAMFDPNELNKAEQKLFYELKEKIKVYFYDINNGGGDEYMQEEVFGRDAKGYAKNQSLPVSGY